MMGAASTTTSTDEFAVRAAGPLEGSVVINGAKNSALKLMAASVLAAGRTRLRNVPAIADVPVMADLLRSTGMEVELDLAAGICTLDAGGDIDAAPDPAMVRAIRASISTLGPLVGRCRRAEIALPGGDDIGKRGIELHLRGLEAMGAVVTRERDRVLVEAATLRGAHVRLDFPSVGATENVLLAAVLADGTTTIENAAREPEVQDLCRMLRQMGADIQGVGQSTLRIVGVEALRPAEWSDCPDRIEAGTFAVAAAITGGDVVLERVRPGDLAIPLEKLAAMGVTTQRARGGLRVAVDGHLRPTTIATLPYPGFPTDLQPQFLVALTQAVGLGRVTENVFEARFAFVEELRRMGADIAVDGHHAVVRGPRRLHGAVCSGLDVRAGAAAVLAGLVAEGETVVRDVHHVDRGYAGFVERLRALGADVERRASGA
jgi:UDP-N-acetylglucosamine 1-carboxyvinyltransferase